MVRWGGAPDHYKARVYVLAVGVSAYPNPKHRLGFAAADAEALATLLQGQRGGLYREVTIRKLTEAEATRDAVRAGLQWLSEAVGQRDVGALFLAGHGLTDKGDYYFLCHDSDPEKLLFSGLGDDDIRKFLGRVAGKTLLFIDTCYSGGLRATRGPLSSQPDPDRLANLLADAEVGVVVFSASTGKELAKEDPALGHGAFSYALLEAIRDGKADFTGNGHVTIDELAVYLDECVQRLTDGCQHPTIAKPEAVPNYPVFRVRI